MIDPVVGESFAFKIGETAYTGLVKAYDKRSGNITVDHFGHDVVINPEKDSIRIKGEDNREQGQAGRGKDQEVPLRRGREERGD